MPQSATQANTLQVGGSVLNITSAAALPDASIDVPYSYQYTASGGLAPYHWVGISGAFPPGLTLSDGGLLSGLPTATGPFVFSVQVTDSGA